MLRATIATLRRHPARLLMSVVAVALGVALVTGTLIFTGILAGNLDRLRVGALPDVLIARDGTYSGTSGDPSQPPAVLTSEDLAAIMEVRGVQTVHGVVSQAALQVLDRDKRVVGEYGVAPQGLNWFEATATDGGPAVRLVAGREPRAAGEVVLDTQTGLAPGMAIGEPVVVVLPGGAEVTATVVGLAEYGSGEATAPRGVWFTLSEAQHLFLDGSSDYTGAWVTTDPEVTPATVRSSVSNILPERMDAWTGERAAALSGSRLSRALRFVDTFVLVFAVIAAVAATFLIVNTFAVVIAGRTREYAVLRMLGASRTQVGGAVAFEALLTGLAGSALGVLAGVGLAMGSGRLINAFDLPMGGTVPIPDGVAVVGLVLGVGVTLVAAVRPARLAGRADPIAVLAGRVTTGEDGLGRIIVPSVLLVLAGGAAVGWAIADDPPFAILFVGAGALAVMVGVTAASPVLGWPVLGALGLAWRLTFGVVGRLAQLNIGRQPRRTATMASALIIGMSLVATMAVLGASTTASLKSQVRASIPGDFRVHDARYLPLDAAVVDRMSGIDGVSDVHELQRIVVTWEGQNWGLMAQQPAAFGRVFDQSLTTGRVPSQSNEVLVDEALARQHAIRAGSRIDVTMPPRKEKVTMTVTGVVAQSDGSQLAAFITVPETLTAVDLPSQVTLVGIDLHSRADPAAVRVSLDEALAESPMVKILDRPRFIAQQLSVIEGLFALVNALLVVAVIVAMLGIVNTLSLSVSERTREIGLLRAVGLTRRQLRWMVRLEAVSVAVLGGSVGVALGVLVASALQRALAVQGLTLLDIPARQLGAVLCASAVLGVIAASWPARIAARLDVVRAVSSE